MRTFFGLGEPGCIHSFEWCFRFGFYERTEETSIATIRPRTSSLSLWYRSNKTYENAKRYFVAPRKYHRVSNTLQVCGNPEYRAECGAQFCDILRLPLLTHAESIGDKYSTGKQGVELSCPLRGLPCTGVVLNGIPALPEYLFPSCHCAILQRCIATSLTWSLKTFLCTTTWYHFNFDPGTLLKFFKHDLRALGLSL